MYGQEVVGFDWERVVLIWFFSWFGLFTKNIYIYMFWHFFWCIPRSLSPASGSLFDSDYINRFIFFWVDYNN